MLVNKNKYFSTAATSLLTFMLIMLLQSISPAEGYQRFSVTPTYREVNPGGSVVLECMVEEMRGECRWEKDGVPVGVYAGKYEMLGSGPGDCSLRVLAASMEYDNGVWQCQVTASDFKQKDTLISDGAQLVVRVSPGPPGLRKEGGGRLSDQLTARAGEDLNLECVSAGGNPAPLLSWVVGGEQMQASLQQADSRDPTSGLWTSVSRLRLPVSRADNGASVECIAEHPATDEPVIATIRLEIFYPPTVSLSPPVEASALVEGADLSVSCLADSNPPARIAWRRVEPTTGDTVLVGHSPELVLDPVARADAGTYQCTAENEIGLSKPENVPIVVHYAPEITGLSESGELTLEAGSRKVLRCRATGSPFPTIQWLQQTTGGEVLVRAYEEELHIEAASYHHQGTFVCSAKNSIGEVQSESVDVRVLGKPEIDRLKVRGEHIVNLGEDLTARVEFCARPLPRVTWNLGGVGQAGRTVELVPGSTFERFHAGASHQVSDQCYSAALLINDVTLADSKEFNLSVENDYGRETVDIRVVVIDTRLFTEEVFAAIVVGGVLTILLLSVIIVYAVRVGCGSGSDSNDKIRRQQQQDLGSDKTDVESCRSSVSNHSHNTVIPPDALYGTIKKTAYFEPVEFNNSKEKLRPDLVMTAATATSSSTEQSPYSGRRYDRGSLDTNISYNSCNNQLQTSLQNQLNKQQLQQQQKQHQHLQLLYGSLRKQKQRDNLGRQQQQQQPEYRSQGVDCRLEKSSSSSHSAASLDNAMFNFAA